ncbi:UDP-N-acetylglucosamine 1-carboxyvinyltransferase [Tenacibaculum maritimum]|uniref:UDP-N-acetylglucosamine 1-carboxyvinyltransferase n=1 Tax=Tenacibaculum maritimum NCIMB 2154 TaxID=1349785 RepID=A0A2H1EBB6_9FLAO|nr:UDP-N-acetylglucosamine 1-carboxyvinyltransferase [Tenacibaculum maritimum]MCD9561756.1 UDP-N-acetylglucosamine 1-carboxyvinyltransferase [Tenacibaculum maritimum]MCD9565192.1 UDP-N-acetylglucosamine 1-carboxyvinyltransferase [Tenacibaculum maritimum]MCD9578592.1 UDP-N-acetylglucosamine 1-carboxyvinyltransferase [Tenacibaculum maritimum]MCD9583576.1 UDP-N-acetylglucosamine 1-carboxyvinyltransferase [Tenacibaculum maritimum]MCD9596545.1 UDP-N-acetylglucosamine 1-carboxyvinyltransferase [Tena
MASFKIEGGHKLSGTITPQGAKNEALQIVCAVLLTPEKVIIKNIPDIIDVNKLIFILGELGVKIEKLAANTYSFQADDIKLSYLESAEFKRDGSSLRGSIMIVGPLLARFGRGYIPRPGGDKIGRRRLDTHFEGFIKLGAKFRYNKEEYFYGVEAQEGLKGTEMLLDEASVTGTANIIMAAVLAEGITTIYNAACEPYIQQLCKMLNAMGAKITGVGSNLLKITGVDSLKGCEHNVLPDMIEIGSWIGMAAMTRSALTIKDVSWKDLGQIPNVFRKIGIKLERKGDDIYIPEQESYEIQNYIDGSVLTVSDAPWPGFTPDLLSIILVVATQAKGTVLIHQKMFESRLFFVDKLIDMGAKVILCDPHRATVIGHDFDSQLKATKMTSPDIRAGISLLIAALSAKGTSIINNIEQIDRGYENIEARLKSIGAKIERIEG